MNELITKTALVTGASGFIGQTLCEVLLRSDYTLKLALRTNSSVTLSNNNSIETIATELFDYEKLENACRNVSTVFHLAGVAHVGNVREEEYQRVNVEGTRVLARAAKSAGVRKFVYVSSILAAETKTKGAATAYSSSKKEAEELLLEMANEKFQCAILRPANVYGPGMKGNIIGMIRRIKSGNLPPLPKLVNSLAMVSVQDLCQAAVLIAESDHSNNKIYVITDGHHYTPNNVENSIYEALGKKQSDWHCPLVIFYLASLCAQFLNILGLWKNDLGLRTFHNLTNETSVSMESQIEELGFKPTRNFSDELPAIISSLRKTD